jgi:hypothetical protein
LSPPVELPSEFNSLREFDQLRVDFTRGFLCGGHANYLPGLLVAIQDRLTPRIPQGIFLTVSHIVMTEGALALRIATRGMTEEQVAERLKTSQSNAHRWLNGKRTPHGKWRGKIEDAFPGVGTRLWDAVVWESKEEGSPAA